MICPHCGEQFRLTWRRYWSTPFARHLCPSCRRVSKLRLTIGYLAALIGLWIVMIGVAAVAASMLYGEAEASGWYWFTAWLAGAVLSLLADKWFDEKLRTLIPLAK